MKKTIQSAAVAGLVALMAAGASARPQVTVVPQKVSQAAEAPLSPELEKRCREDADRLMTDARSDSPKWIKVDVPSKPYLDRKSVV